MKTILLFGYLPRDLARNWILDHGLLEQGFGVLECRTKKKGFIGKCIDLTRQFWGMRRECDVILVTFMGYYFVPLAWVLATLTGKKLIFDSLVSLYESEVEDRKRISRFDPRALALFLFEWLCYILPNLVLLESPVYAGFLKSRFHISKKKFLALPVGCRSDIFHPAKIKSPNAKFRVLYQGRFIPVHGVETIIEAAAIIQGKGIQDIEFHFVGKGQTEHAMREKAKEMKLTNVIFRGFLPTLEDVAEETRQADVGLGMFQKSSKCDLCMPHKVYEVLASNVPLITAKTTSSDAIFGRAKVALFVPQGNAKALADAIIQLKDDKNVRESIACKGYAFFMEHFQPHMIMKPLAEYLMQSEKS
ncbi:MAG TPA: glycosyltransferase [Candidatus Peribacterales bacterium]|nr:glycosyltransferase [Candidatus Peribacterales bacterium]